MHKHERSTMRSLAARWMELASSPLMQERRRLWTALKDRKAERPMFLFETWTLEGYIHENELVCQDSYLRDIEHILRRSIRQAEEVGDDFVLDPVFRLSWHAAPPAYGVGLDLVRAQDDFGGSHAYHYNHPIRTPADVSHLQPRTWKLDKQRTRRDHAVLQDLFGDILPVTIHGAAFFLPGLTADLYRLIGNDNLLTWIYDEPEALHAIMAFLRDDRLHDYRWLEAETMLGLNNNSSEVGSGSPGFVSDLPQMDFDGQVRLRDLWVWIESQETTMISPKVFAEFFLPYMAEISKDFGLVYYGCCEPVHDRWDQIITAIPNIRAVSISPWCDHARHGRAPR